MPEFILDTGSAESSRAFKELDSFTQGYIEAMFFTEEERLCEEFGRDMPAVAFNTETMESRFVGGDSPGFAELASDTLARIVKDCEAFQRDNAALLESVYGVTGKHERAPYDESRAGNDYWYSRNGHGTGYWDRGLGDAGEALADAARYSERYLVRGDDGLIYLE